MFKNKIFVVLCLLILGVVNAQEETKINFTLTGFINLSSIYDSRQITGLRENHFLLYPKPILKDVSGKDINDAPSYNFAAILSRVGLKLDGPVFLGAKASAFLETEFMGNSEADVNGLRIRHAYLTLAWKKFEITAGQTWSLLLHSDAPAMEYGSNYAAPFNAFARNPQLRLTAIWDNFRFNLAALTERDFQSSGINGSSTEYIRNAAMPILQFSVNYKTPNEYFGISAEYKTIKPELKTTKNFYTN